MTGMGAHEQLLIRCLTRHFAEQASDELEQEIVEADSGGAAVDWQRLLELAQKHRVAPLIYRAILQNWIADVPSEIIRDVEVRARMLAIHGTYQASRLVEVVRELDGAGVRVIPIKGPILAAGDYGDIGLRDSLDLDLLVAPEDVNRTARVLTKIGYSGWDVDAARLPALIRSGCEHSFECESCGVALDLHWKLSPPYFPLELSFAELWAKRRPVTLAGRELPAMSSEDELLHLCFHATKHVWCDLSLVCDVAAVLTAQPTVDWDRLLELARRTRTRDILLLGLHLARSVLGVQLPKAVGAVVDKRGGVHSLSTRLVRRLAGESVSCTGLAKEIRTSLFYIRVRERFVDRARFCLRVLMPNVRDWQRSRLPAWMTFLHMFSRPIRHLVWLVRKQHKPGIATMAGPSDTIGSSQAPRRAA
jgi:hypothetical protein